MGKQQNNEAGSQLAAKLDKVAADVEQLKVDVGFIKGGGMIGGGVIGLLLLAVIGGIWWAGESKIREISRAVLREELQYRNTIVQQGRFTADNKISDDPLTFSWKLQKQVDSDKLISVVAEPLTAVPGVAIFADVAPGGGSCRMILLGDAETLSALQLPIDAKVTITERQ
ncbi:MAG: hypothetical protein SGJ19_02090 [Planctomycetia bacterium]|nr:hypothetical protein [Planctomycetia bacterium]